jgi:hypothetical protein
MNGISYGNPKTFPVAGGAASIHDGPAVRLCVVLTAGGAAASATIREGGALGTDVFSLAAAANTSSAPVYMNIKAPYLAAIAGANSSLNVTIL